MKMLCNFNTMANKKKKEKEKPKVHKDLDGFEISINSFGEIQSLGWQRCC